MKVFFILLLTLCVCVPVFPLQAQQKVIFKPADTVVIELNEPAEHSKEISADYRLSDEGTLRLPKLCGEIEAKGIACAALVRKIEEAYKKEGIFKKSSVVVRVPVEHCRHVAIVSGEVRNPSENPLRVGMRLLDVIAKAGGMTELADSSAVKLIGDKKTTLYDLRKIKEDGSNNPPLQDGDTIIVPSR